MSVAGIYDCTTSTPMGPQTGVFTVEVDGNRFTGSIAGAMGSLTVEDGKVDGDRLSWTMAMTVPMPMALEGEALVSGDSLMGSIKAGVFGAMAIKGTRRS